MSDLFLVELAGFVHFSEPRIPEQLVALSLILLAEVVDVLVAYKTVAGDVCVAMFDVVRGAILTIT